MIDRVHHAHYSVRTDLDMSYLRVELPQLTLQGIYFVWNLPQKDIVASLDLSSGGAQCLQIP